METKTCTRCDEPKPIDDFNFKNKAKGTRQSACKACSRKEGQSHYHRNRKKVIRKATHRGRIAYGILSKKMTQMKDSLECVVCGESHNCCLDFHHTDPSKKDKAVSNMLANCSSWERILSEIEKCVVLCSNCHRKVHADVITLP